MKSNMGGMGGFSNMGGFQNMNNGNMKFNMSSNGGNIDPNEIFSMFMGGGGLGGFGGFGNKGKKTKMNMDEFGGFGGFGGFDGFDMGNMGGFSQKFKPQAQSNKASKWVF